MKQLNHFPPLSHANDAETKSIAWAIIERLGDLISMITVEMQDEVKSISLILHEVAIA